jgi:pSer/pThr/pTyr-binding forkhead associated (FHA) protein
MTAATTVLIHEDGHAQPVELISGEQTLGRAADNQLQIIDTTVSAHHARIYTYFYVSYIEDLQSTNGTFVNGKRITKQLLKPGDVVHLGSYPLRFELKGSSRCLSKTG